MRVLVACEFSGVVREAFRRLGHDAWSCDILAAEDGSPYHIQGDVRWVLAETVTPWDLMIAHPPCTFMANSGARWLYERGTRRKVAARWAALDEAVKLIGALWSTDKAIRVAIENPIMHKHARQRFGFEPTQIFQPWQFGHKEMKATCLWLRGLPMLESTNIVGPPPKDKIARRKWAKVHQMPPGPNRWKERSRTYEGIAAAMAAQWGGKA